MATLREIMKFVCDCAAQSGEEISHDLIIQIETKLRRQYPAERIYIPPADSRKDPERQQRIQRELARLPSGVVAERNGVSRRWVNRIAARKNHGGE